MREILETDNIWRIFISFLGRIQKIIEDLQ
jgi:hypothetical protein